MITSSYLGDDQAWFSVSGLVSARWKLQQKSTQQKGLELGNGWTLSFQKKNKQIRQIYGLKKKS